MVYIAKNEEQKIAEGIKASILPPPSGSSMSAKFDYVMSQISPKTSLYLGLAISIMTICTIGFVVLLWIAIK